MLAVFALVFFIVAMIVLGTVHGWVFWMLLGLAALAADHIYPYTPWVRGRRVP